MTKFSIVSPDREGRVDGAVWNFLQRIPNLCDYSQCDVVLVPITRLDNFQFNGELYYNSKPWVLIDYCEYGWDWDRMTTHLFGKNTHDFDQFSNNTQWYIFDDFVRHNPPTLYFKRELLQKDRDFNILPIEYPCLYPDSPIQTKEEFENRPIEVFNTWGHSHEARVNLHGNMFLHAGRFGYYLIDSFRNLELCMEFEKNPMKWASIYCPYFSRIEMADLLRFQGMSKISVSMPGAGVKCFRHSEAPINAIMFMQEDDLAWSFPWVHAENCLKVDTGYRNRFSSSDSDPYEIRMKKIKGECGSPEILALWEYSYRSDLYNIYVTGVENCRRYEVGRYFSEYIIPKIEQVL